MVIHSSVDTVQECDRQNRIAGSVTDRIELPECDRKNRIAVV